jgi:hypothetical protein
MARWRASEGVLLAFLTASAYWIAFRYEASYLAVFGFPADAVEVSLNSTLVVMAAVGGGLWLLFSIGNLVAISWPSQPALQVKAARVVLILLFPVWDAINYSVWRISDTI